MKINNFLRLQNQLNRHYPPYKSKTVLSEWIKKKLVLCPRITYLIYLLTSELFMSGKKISPFCEISYCILTRGFTS